MPLTPSQILSANQAVFGGGGSSYAGYRARRDAGKSAAEELLAEDEEESGPGLWDTIKEKGGQALKPVGEILDFGRAAATAGAIELGDLARQVGGKDPLGSTASTVDTGFSLDDFIANTKSGVGFGDVLETTRETAALPLNVKRGIGIAGDIAIDPLNIATSGPSVAAKAGMRRLGAAAGDDVVQVLARGGKEGEALANNVLLERFTAQQAEREAARETAAATRARIGTQWRDEATDFAPRTLFDAPAHPRLGGIAPDALAAVDDDLTGAASLLDSPTALPGSTIPPTVAAEAVEQAPTVRGLLGEGTSPEGLQHTMEAIERTGIGGIRLEGGKLFGGRNFQVATPDQLRALPGIAKATQAGQTFKQSEIGKALRQATVPFTKTRDAFTGDAGSYLAEAMPGIYRRRQAAGEALDGPEALAELESVADGLYDTPTEDIIIDASSGVKKPKGFTRVGDKFVKKEIADDLFNVSKAGTQHKVVQNWDTMSSLIKRHTLFNVVSFPPYLMQNVATGVSMGAAKAGVGPRLLTQAATDGRLVARAAKEGGDFGEALARLVPDEAARKRIHGALTEGQMTTTGEIIHDDVADAATAAAAAGDQGALRQFADGTGKFGTKNTVAANQFAEETMRTAAYYKGLEDGLTSSQAADLSESIHLNYTAIGRTRLERDVLNRFVFFPTWLFRAPGAIVKAYAHRPGLFNAQARLEMGGEWEDRPRNSFGELIGPRLSGPASFLTGLGAEGSQGINKPTDLLHPLAKVALDPDARKLDELLPPLASISRAQGVAEGAIEEPNAKRSRYIRSLFGVRTGADYDAENGLKSFQEELAKRVEDRKANPDLDETTPSIRLTRAAIEAGIGATAYSMTNKELAQSLREKGLTVADLEVILRGSSGSRFQP